MGGRVGSITTEIIADGLVFNMDAANRVSTKPISTIATSFNTVDTNVSGAFSDNGIFDSSTISPSFAFGGTDDYISINSDTVLDDFHQNPFSVNLWFKTSTGGTMILCEKATSTSGTARAFYIYLSSGAILWYGATSSPTYTDSAYNDGNWHYLACVAESDTVARIYIDGVEDTNNIAKDRIGTSTVSANINVGTTYNAGGFFFNGNIGPYHIYNRALSSTEVLHNYNALKGRFGL